MKRLKAGGGGVGCYLRGVLGFRAVGDGGRATKAGIRQWFMADFKADI